MQLITYDPKNFFFAFLLFIGGCFSFKSPETVEISTPSSVYSTIEYSYPALLIEIRKDQTIWYGIIADKAGKASIKVSEPVRKNLGKAIADYKKRYPDQKQYLVKGHSDSEYHPFEKVMAALRDNEQYKYNLITMDKDDN